MKDITFKQIGQFQYAEEAHIIKGKIASEGIEVFVRDHLTINADPLISQAIGGVELFVRQEDYKEAMSILSEVSEFSLDDSGNLNSCPNCGAMEMELVHTIKDFKSFFAFLFSIISFTLPLFVRFKYQCHHCGFETEYKREKSRSQLQKHVKS